MSTNSMPKAAVFQQDISADDRAKLARERPALMRRIINDLNQAWELYARQFEGSGKLPPIT